MSAETLEWLRSNVRIGYANENGPAWWANRGECMADGSHFEGPVPAEEVRRLLAVPIVEAAPFMKWTDADGTEHEIEDEARKAYLRTDTGDVLGVFKRSYGFHDYEPWTLGMIEAITDAKATEGGAPGDGEIGIASAGLLRKGGQVWVQARLPQTFEVEGFGFVPNITAANSCDGSLMATFFTGVDAVVCDNTYRVAEANAATITKKRHGRNSPGRIAEVRMDLGLMLKTAEAFDAKLREWLAVDVTDADFALWLDEMAPQPAEPESRGGKVAARFADAKREELTRLWKADPKVAPWAGTKLGILQAANTWRTWAGSVKAAPGGAFQRHLENWIDGTQALADTAALDAIDRVQARRLVLA